MSTVPRQAIANAVSHAVTSHTFLLLQRKGMTFKFDVSKLIYLDIYLNNYLQMLSDI